MKDLPQWTNGNFSGVWGITLFGAPLDTRGWISRNYENIGMGQIYSVYGTFNETNPSSILRGYML